MGDHVRRSYLLLEGNPRFASGFTAFGLADARAGSAEEAVTEEADVIELCCALLVDGQAAPCFAPRIAPRISPCVAACVAACCATRAHCVYNCVHRVESASADEAWAGEQYFRMRVIVEDAELALEAFHVASAAELPVTASLASRREMLRTYQALGPQERYINLQVQFAVYAVIDVDEGGAVYQAVGLMG